MKFEILKERKIIKLINSISMHLVGIVSWHCLHSSKGLTAGQNVCNLQLFIATCQNACKMQNTCTSGTFGTFAKWTVKNTCTFGISGTFAKWTVKNTCSFGIFGTFDFS